MPEWLTIVIGIAVTLVTTGGGYLFVVAVKDSKQAMTEVTKIKFNYLGRFSQLELLLQETKTEIIQKHVETMNEIRSDLKEFVSKDLCDSRHK